MVLMDWSKCYFDFIHLCRSKIAGYNYIYVTYLVNFRHIKFIWLHVIGISLSCFMYCVGVHACVCACIGVCACMGACISVCACMRVISNQTTFMPDDLQNLPGYPESNTTE